MMVMYLLGEIILQNKEKRTSKNIQFFIIEVSGYPQIFNDYPFLIKIIENPSKNYDDFFAKIDVELLLTYYRSLRSYYDGEKITIEKIPLERQERLKKDLK